MPEKMTKEEVVEKIVDIVRDIVFDSEIGYSSNFNTFKKEVLTLIEKL